MFHRNLLILLGKLPLRQNVINQLKWLLTEGSAEKQHPNTSFDVTVPQNLTSLIGCIC